MPLARDAHQSRSPTEALNSSGLRGEPSLSSPAVPIPAPPLIKEFQLRGVLPHGETFASKSCWKILHELRESPTDSRISCLIQPTSATGPSAPHSAPLTRNSHLSTRIINQSTNQACRQHRPAAHVQASTGQHMYDVFSRHAATTLPPRLHQRRNTYSSHTTQLCQLPAVCILAQCARNGSIPLLSLAALPALSCVLQGTQLLSKFGVVRLKRIAPTAPTGARGPCSSHQSPAASY